MRVACCRTSAIRTDARRDAASAPQGTRVWRSRHDYARSGMTRRSPRTERLAAALLLCALPGCSGVEPCTDPERARLVTDDIPRFWQAFDARQQLGTAQPIETLYLEPGTPGLREWKRKRLDDAATMAKTVDACAAYYASARARPLRLPEGAADLRASVR